MPLEVPWNATTESAAILLNTYYSHKYMCKDSSYNYFCRYDTFYTHFDNFWFELHVVPSNFILNNLSRKERLKPWFFVTFNIIICFIFPENSIENPLKVFTVNINYFHHFYVFSIYLCDNESNDVTIYIFYFQPSLNRLFNSCIPSKKTFLKKPCLIRVWH